jgi:hypothetical protein
MVFFGYSRQLKKFARCWWLTPVFIATQQAENRRITV